MFILETHRLLLRPFQLSDAKRVQELAGEIEVARTTLNIPHPYPDGIAESWIQSRQDVAEKGSGYTLAVTLRENSELIGCIGLGVAASHKRAELGYWIGKSYWGMGYATEAAKCLTKFGFEELGLNRIFAAAFASNQASFNVMKKIGMKYEGLFPQHILKWDEPVDIVFYGILKNDFLDRGSGEDEFETQDHHECHSSKSS